MARDAGAQANPYRPRVSVVTIFLDPGTHFAAALASVRDQTYADHEHLLIDDGSSDGSTEVARAAVAADPGRVRYLRHVDHANLGMSRSRNVGVTAARGELVAFLDADDLWLPDALEQQITALDRHPSAQMAVGATRYWWPDADGGPIEHDLLQRPVGLVPPPKLARERLYQVLPPPSMNAVLARRSALRAVGGFEDDFRGMYEDQAMLVKFFLAHPVVVHDGVIDRYRQHERSASARAIAAGHYDPVVPGPAMRTFRSFASEHVRSTVWRGTLVDREARWFARWDRFGPTRRLVFLGRPDRLARLRRRLPRRGEDPSAPEG